MSRLFTNCVLDLSLFVLAQAKISDGENSLKLQWYENVTEHISDPTKHLVQSTKLYEEIVGTILLAGTNFTFEYPDSVSWRKSAGFVDTVFFAYRKHHNLIIRPDAIWTAIIVQFSRYVNANAEALRHRFVNFKGKKTVASDIRCTS